MGSRIDFHCSKCGKQWVEDFQYFYLMSDDRIEESGLMFLTSQIERRSVAKGSVYETYCRDCDKDIKLYLIEEVKTEYPSIDQNKIIEEYKHKPNIIFGDYTDFKDGMKVKCCNCGEDIILKADYDLEMEFNLNCNSYNMFCGYCQEYTTVYAIKPPLREYTTKEAYEKIEKLIDENSLVGFAKDYEGISEINCPFCDKEIPIQNSFDKCPKCDGELKCVEMMMYD
ncbi:hypothetical protein [Methanosphaera sp. BMS]|uniref:hypothetical protein n=1 Tax=Methanosphaera sp. BMS TaxID=1789762 RepID=UPI000DC1EE2D|nr:hypothetical protein [Methanosphaera sp. BMS]AWX31840.1 hypothetical protein AW729_01480 [Methanosphaera sp. BMS]